MKMEKSEVVGTVATKVARTNMSNGRVKLNRIIMNMIRSLFVPNYEKKLATVDELGVDGIFKDMEKQKAKLDVIFKAQDAAIESYDDAAKVETKKSDNEVKKLQKQIKEAEKALQTRLANSEAQKVAIGVEKERINVLNDNMTKFFTKRL